MKYRTEKKYVKRRTIANVIIFELLVLVYTAIFVAGILI